MQKKRGLGRDLSSLLGGVTTTAAPQNTASVLTDTMIAQAPIAKSELRKLPVEYLERGRFQPRQVMTQETLQELADSIKAQGIIQPIIVRAISDKRFEIIAGERRWRAAQLAGLTEVPVLVKNFSDTTAMAIALIENVQREDLNPMEKAIALKRLIDEYGLSHESLAEAVGQSRVTITNLLRLLNLNPDVKQMVEAGQLDMGHARALLSLEGFKQSEAAKQIVRQGLSVRGTERLVRKLLSGKIMVSSKAPMDPDVRQLQTELSQKLGASVTIQHGKKGKGKLVITYNSLDEFEGILSHIQ